jgi:hypothetical protein
MVGYQKLAIHGEVDVIDANANCFYPHLMAKRQENGIRNYKEAWLRGCFNLPALKKIFIGKKIQAIQTNKEIWKW